MFLKNKKENYILVYSFKNVFITFSTIVFKIKYNIL